MSTRRIASAHGGYSESVSVEGAGRLVHIAGQLGTGIDGSGSGDPIGVQAGRAFDGLARALEAQGATLTDVISMNTYVTTFDGWADVARVRGERFVSSTPASTAVQVAGLMGGAAIEIDAVAFVPAQS